MMRKTRKWRVRYGRVLACTFLLATLTYGIVKIVDLTMTEQDTSSSQEAIILRTEAAADVFVSEQEALPAAEPSTKASEAPKEMKLEVPYISQEGVLPTGCELISAKMVLEYYGTKTTVEKIVDNTFCSYPVTKNGKTYGYSPYRAFIGSPYDESSFGCYPPVIVDMLNSLLPEDKVAVDITGMELSEIAERYIPCNTPILVWATINMKETYSNVGWYLLNENGEKTDEWYDWKANEHCLVLVGYDSENYYFNDPYQDNGQVSYSRELTEKRYAEIGKCAVIVEER